MRNFGVFVFTASLGLCACADPPPEGACSSGDFWTGGDEESPSMHPGSDCIDCHTREGEGPRYALAGTIMGGSDDVTDCNGVDDVQVEIVDKDGEVALTLTSNAAGNFFAQSALAETQLSYTVRVSKGGETREMVTPQTDQNCMTCHTAEGSGGAPGRILAP